MDYVARTPAQLAQLLRGCRKQKHLSQKETGSRVGLLPKTISALEATPERSTIDSLYKLMSALDLELVLRDKNGQSSEMPDVEW